MNPTVVAEEAETWSGAGIVSSHTVSWRQNPGLPPPAVGPLFLLFDHSAALGEALTPVWRGGLQVMGGSGCNSCWRLPFRSDTHHSL